MSKSFRTISKPTQGLFKDRGSKFLAYAFPVTNVLDVKPLLQNLRSEHATARHVCYAYLIGSEAKNHRANDDGEPNGTAGLPILNQIKSKGVTNTLVAVVRYFGGTKLGISGLINAYKQAAKDALEQARVIEKIPMRLVSIEFPLSNIGKVERIIHQLGVEIKNRNFDENCCWDIEIPFDELDKAKSAFRSLNIKFYFVMS